MSLKNLNLVLAFILENPSIPLSPDMPKTAENTSFAGVVVLFSRHAKQLQKIQVTLILLKDI